MQNSEQRVVLIAGLGNPGQEYVNTRHNAGFEVIERLIERIPGTLLESHKCDSRCFDGRFRGRNIGLLMPQTYMNLSGLAVAGIARKRGVTPQEILLISDDLDLPLGKLRIRRGGSTGGHRGIESVTKELGSADFIRLRIGIGKAKVGDTVDHVLGKVSETDLPLYNESLDAATDAVIAILTAGVSRAMNQFNAWKPAKVEEACKEEQ